MTDQTYSSSQPLVTVLITSYNHEQYIEAAIDSVLAQTYKHFECIVVDDGSRDSSVARIQRYSQHLRLVQQENGGQASAINAGSRMSTGSLICFMDSDDLWNPRKLELVVQAANNSSARGLILHNLGIVDARGSCDPKPYLPQLWSGHVAHQMWKTGPWWPRPVTSGIAIPKSLFDQIAPIPAELFRISPDAYIATLGAFLGPVTAVQTVLGYWRWHGANATVAGLEERCRRQARFIDGINLGLRERLLIARQIAPEDVWWHQWTRYRHGLPVSPFHLTHLALSNPAERPSARLRSAARIWLSRRILQRQARSNSGMTSFAP